MNWIGQQPTNTDEPILSPYTLSILLLLYIILKSTRIAADRTATTSGVACMGHGRCRTWPPATSTWLGVGCGWRRTRTPTTSVEDTATGDEVLVPGSWYPVEIIWYLVGITLVSTSIRWYQRVSIFDTNVYHSIPIGITWYLASITWKLVGITWYLVEIARYKLGIRTWYLGGIRFWYRTGIIPSERDFQMLFHK